MNTNGETKKGRTILWIVFGHTHKLINWLVRKCSIRLAWSRTSPFHGGNRGSNPLWSACSFSFSCSCPCSFSCSFSGTSREIGKTGESKGSTVNSQGVRIHGGTTTWFALGPWLVGLIGLIGLIESKQSKLTPSAGTNSGGFTRLMIWIMVGSSPTSAPHGTFAGA